MKYDALIASFQSHLPRMAPHVVECFDAEQIKQRGTDKDGFPLPCCDLEVVSRELARLRALQIDLEAA